MDANERRRRAIDDDRAYRDDTRTANGDVAPRYEDDEPRAPRYEDDEVRAPRYDDEPRPVGESPPRREQLSGLFSQSLTEDFWARWDEIQTNFVDDPRQAVDDANALVGDVTDRLHEMFTSTRNDLEAQWSAGKEASTEDLRQAMQQYRSFFQRLLSL